MSLLPGALIGLELYLPLAFRSGLILLLLLAEKMSLAFQFLKFRGPALISFLCLLAEPFLQVGAHGSTGVGGVRRVSGGCGGPGRIYKSSGGYSVPDDLSGIARLGRLLDDAGKNWVRGRSDW